MFPTLIDLGTHDLPFVGETHLFLPTYGALFATAAVVAWWWFLRRARTLDIPDDDVFNLSFYALLAGIFGAKLMLVAIDWRGYLAHPGELLGTLRSAGVLMGGVIAGALVFVVYGRRRGLPLARLADALVAPLALAQSIGRLGCHSAGCCWGVRAHEHARFAVTFTNPMAREQTGVPLGIAFVPTQLYQMIHDLLLALLLTWMWRRGLKPAGTVLWTYVLLYSIGRATLEIWRGDLQRGLYFGGAVSTSQLLAAAGMLLAATMLARGRLQQRSLTTGATARAER